MSSGGDRQRVDLKKRQPKEILYIALLDLDFSWYPQEVKRVKQLWNKGAYIVDIAEQLGRDMDEVAILIMDMARQELIKPRKGGVFGWE